MGVPDERELRLSDTDRERAVQRLNEAVAEGRLTLPEFEERVAGALAARTNADLAPHLAGLPATQRPAARDEGEVRTSMSTVKRTGRWAVPRRLRLHNKAGTIKLDLTEATFPGPSIDIIVENFAGTITIVVPHGTSANVEAVEPVASTTKAKVPDAPVPGGGPHLLITGKLWAGTLVVRYQRRFWRWRW